MIKLKPFRQKIGYCGPSALKMVLGFFGVEKTEEELADLSKISMETGTTGENLAFAAEKLGFKTEIKDNCDFDDIRNYIFKKQLPVIVDWFSVDEGHYSVVVDIDTENIYLQDPSFGQLRAIRLETFKRIWFDFEGEFLKSKNDLLLRRLIVIYK